MSFDRCEGHRRTSDLDRYVDRLGVLVQRDLAQTALVAAKDEAEANAQAARSMMLEAESASLAKSQFLANMSHELRTPLNAIIGFSEIMASGAMGPDKIDKYREYAYDICESGKHLLDLINDILDLSKIEAAQEDLDDKPVDFAGLAVSCVKLIEHRAQEAGVTLIDELARPLPLIRGDERRLKQVLINLLSNSLKFTPHGGEIALGARIAPDGSIVAYVRDNGIGIAPGNLKSVLDPFTQVANVYTQEHQGTGLGLPLCKSLVELHGGSLTLESEIGLGTRVTISLPADRVLPGPQEALPPGFQAAAHDPAAA